MANSKGTGIIDANMIRVCSDFRSASSAGNGQNGKLILLLRDKVVSGGAPCITRLVVIDSRRGV